MEKGDPRHYDNDYVQPNCQVRKEGEALEGSDLPEDEAQKHEDYLCNHDYRVCQHFHPVYQAHDALLTAEEPVAIDPSSHLSKTLTTALDDQNHIEKELEALQEVHAHTSPVAVDSKGNITIV